MLNDKTTHANIANKKNRTKKSAGFFQLRKIVFVNYSNNMIRILLLQFISAERRGEEGEKFEINERIIWEVEFSRCRKV